MTKAEYRAARRIIRDNGAFAYKWLGNEWQQLRDLANTKDWLAERADIVAYCKREGLQCNPRQTGRR